MEDDENDDDYVSESENAESDGSDSSEAETDGEDSDETGADNAGNGPLPPKGQKKRKATVPNMHWARPNLAPPLNIPFTAQSGVQVDTQGFEPIEYLTFFINDDV